MEDGRRRDGIFAFISIKLKSYLTVKLPLRYWKPSKLISKCCWVAIESTDNCRFIHRFRTDVWELVRRLLLKLIVVLTSQNYSLNKHIHRMSLTNSPLCKNCGSVEERNSSSCSCRLHDSGQDDAGLLWNWPSKRNPNKEINSLPRDLNFQHFQ